MLSDWPNFGGPGVLLAGLFFAPASEIKKSENQEIKQFQRKIKGQQLKGKIFHTFSHLFALFQTFSMRTFPFKTKGFSSMRTKEKKR